MLCSKYWSTEQLDMHIQKFLNSQIKFTCRSSWCVLGAFCNVIQNIHVYLFLGFYVHKAHFKDNCGFKIKRISNGLEIALYSHSYCICAPQWLHSLCIHLHVLFFEGRVLTPTLLSNLCMWTVFYILYSLRFYFKASYASVSVNAKVNLSAVQSEQSL